MAMSLPAHINADDLYSAGLVGLLQSIRNFHAQGGASFETFARFRIRGAVLDELRRMDWVPRSVHEKTRKIQSVMDELEQQKGGDLPSEEEIARALRISLGEYHEWLDEVKPATFVSLDSILIAENAEQSRYESVADGGQADPREGTSQNELTQLILARLKQLPEMQRKVLALYYFEDLRLREIAEAFGVTESRICQVHAQAILTIKSYLRRIETGSA
jgi:RNA polymerase sigma factor for flagellar operon FliA